MLRNVWSKASLEQNKNHYLETVDSGCEPNLTSSALHKKIVPEVNRDSGIFEDFNCSTFNLSEEEEEKEAYFLPDLDLDSVDKEDYLQPDLDLSDAEKDPDEDCLQPGFDFSEEDKANYFVHETDLGSDIEGSSSDEDELSSSCDSDRKLHASLSSLDTAVASTSLSISLSSLTSSSTEEEQDAASDFDLSSSSSSDSDEEFSENCSEEENDTSNSFGYHSLLNDLTPDGDEPFELDFQELKASRNEENLPQTFSLSNFVKQSLALPVTSVSPALSFYDNHPSSHCQSEQTSNCSNFDSSESISSREVSDDESPSDIELRMAETEVKMCDALLSSGREDLALRKMHFQSTDLMVGAALNLKQMHTNDFKPPNNNLNNNYQRYIETNNDKSKTGRTDLNLPLASTDSRERTSWSDNRINSTNESPIVDAYEKECRDAPEKIAKELENREKELESKQRFLENRQQELENELQALENKQQALESKKKQDSLDRVAEMCTEMDIEHDQDLLAFEAVMIEAIKNKEAGGGSQAPSVIDLGDDSMRHRPSPQQRRRERTALRRNIPSAKNSIGSPEAGEFDVYTMETALPKIDWEVLEEHFKASQEEEEKWRRTDREEIRKKLAMGTDDNSDDSNRQTKKPSLHSRLQNGKNLQICFMNETASDCESQCSDTESTQDRIDEIEAAKHCSKEKEMEPKEFLTYQARLQEEARMALTQAKEMARMQMQLEKQSQEKSPITEIVRGSFNKIGFPCPENKRRMSRQVLTDMNVAQLQVIVNEFHTQIENLNEILVKLLLQRDDLHMEQDSMLVDIEDLNKHLGAKDGCVLLTNDNKPSKNNKRSLKSTKLRPFLAK